MTYSQARREVVRRWGKRGHLRLDKRALDRDEREAMRAELVAMPKPKDCTREERKRRDELIGLVNFYRCTIGEISGVGGMTFFVNRGWGDDWDEAFKRADESESI